MSRLPEQPAAVKFDLAAIKARLPEYLGTLGEVKEQRGKLVACCPLHEDRHPSLVAEEKGGTWIWFCHPCGIGGSVIDLHMKRTGLSEGDAIRELGQMFNSPTLENSTPAIKPLPKPKAQRYAPTAAELARAAKAAQMLALDDHLIERIAKARSWQPETIRRLARECSLGWEDHKLAFVYPTGMKLRWRQRGERMIIFGFGKAHSLWREHMREQSTARVIITEGETDAIRLIDLGLDDAITRIMAVPSASTWPLDAENKLRGLREVIFCPDNDEAGQKHVGEWIALVRRSVPLVRVINWNTL